MVILVSELTIQADQLVKNGITNSTKATYSAPQRQFFQFCLKIVIQALPANDQTILLFLTHLHNKKLSYNTCKVYMSAIKSLHLLNNLVPPNFQNPRFRLALRAIKNKSPEPTKKNPITFNVMKMIWPLLYKANNELCIKAMLTLAFFGGLRGSEFLTTIHSTGPTVNCISFQSSTKGTVMKFQVVKSKTKPHGFSMPYMCSGHKICALCDMEHYLEHRNKMGTLSPNSPLFEMEGKQVTKQVMSAILKKLIQKLGLSTEGYSLHSIRYGATTTAAKNKFADWELKLIGGWSTNTYRTYINTRQSKHRARFSKRLTQ